LKTMRLAQQLYEGVDIKGAGTIGIITYLRTDSTRISDEANQMAQEYITSVYGENYVASHVIEKKTSSSNIQDAHEAIRPTNIHLTTTEVIESLSRDQFRLYQLIWKRFTASRMARSEEHTSELQSRFDLVCRLLLE